MYVFVNMYVEQNKNNLIYCKFSNADDISTRWF